jgi:hypothetical protein
MKEKHAIKDNFLTKTNYLNHYSLNLLMASLFLTLPTFSVMLLIVLWEDFAFLWVAPLFGIFGWFLVIPSTYTITRPSKERVAVDALGMGFMAMLLLCVILIPYKQPSLTDLLKPPSSGIAGHTAAPFDLKEAEETYLEQIRSLREELKREEGE